jgi:3-methyladenine DNA glycosylase AlkD
MAGDLSPKQGRRKPARGEQRLGVSITDLRRIVKETGKDHGLALELWGTGIPDAMIPASMVDRPEDVTPAQMERWVKDFVSWDVCDQVCMNLFEKAPPAREKIFDWAGRGEEFVRRAAFALIAYLAWHDKTSTDERNFVRKAVNWALRNIGKRSPGLNAAAAQTAREVARLASRAARWIASDALRELEGEAVSRPRRASAPRIPRSCSCRPPSPGRGLRRPSS